MKSVKQFFSCVAIFFLITFSTWSQSLRDYVCVVRGNLSSENKTFLTDLKDSLERNGYSFYAGYIGSFLEGTFGSGFIWYAPDGKPYIVTNRHVVGGYESVNLSFDNDDGSVSEFKELKIVFSDDEVDIALVALPASFKKDGLVFSSAKISDGDDVYSAGFPGLAGEPSWQFGKGIISNSSAKIKDLISPDISTVIQHTAQVDGGNSGGPLLLKDSSVKSGYKVCGVNTWSANSRQNTNFSIPAATVEKLIKSKFIQKEDNSFDNASVKFIKATEEKDDFSKLVSFISNAMVSAYGEKALKDVLAKAPSDVRSYISDVFEYHPIEGLRYSLAYQVWKKIYSDSNRTDVKEVQDEATGKKVIFVKGENSFNSFWIEEQGNWKLSEFEGVEADSKKAKKDKARNNSGSIFSFEDPGIFSIAGGYLRNINDAANGFTIDLQTRFNVFSIGMFAMKDTVVHYAEYYVDVWNFKDSDKKAIATGVFCFGPQISLRVPLKFGDFLALPFAEAHAGIAIPKNFFDSNLFPVYAGFGGGVEFAWCTDYIISPFAGAKFMLNNFFQKNPDDVFSKPEFSIYAGIKLGTW